MNVETEAAIPIEHDGSDGTEPVRPIARTRTGLRAAYLLSALIAGMMVLASTAGVFVPGLYRDGSWARQAFRGGDLVTLAVASPLLIASVVLSMRGSGRAVTVWIAMLGYSIYNYAYYVFGASFNDAFLLHIVLLSTSIFALTRALPALDIAARFPQRRAVRLVGAFLVLVGLGQGGLWIFLALRFAFTGQLLKDIPADGQHLVFALDLSLLVPTLVVAGALLYRGTAMGFGLGSAVSVFGAVYQLNLMLAGVFQANAGVAGVKAFPLEGIVLTAAFAAAWAALLWHRQDMRPPRGPEVVLDLNGRLPSR